MAGHLLVATPQLTDPNFYRTVVLMLQHDEAGAVGVVLNRATDEKVVDHLPEWVATIPDPGVIHFGGPVEPEMAICLGMGTEGETTGVDGLVLVDLSGDQSQTSGQLRVYSGYAGWGLEQLEMEIALGSWYVVKATLNDPFVDVDVMWGQVLKRQKGLLSLMSTYPDDVRMN